MTTQLLTAIAMGLVTVAIMSARRVPIIPVSASAGFSGVMGYLYWQYCLPAMVVVLVGGYVLAVPGLFRQYRQKNSDEPVIIDAEFRRTDV